MDKYILKAGVPTQHTDAGSFFRILSSDAEVQIRFIGDGWDLDTPLKAGIGLDFARRSSPYRKILITSDVDQTIEYFAGWDVVDDDRLAASATVIVSTAGKTANVPLMKTLNDTVNGVEVLPALATRRSATYSITGNCFVLDKDNGIKLKAGLYSWDNQSPLTLFPEVAGVEFRVLEEGE
ncbi:hypothetical protein [Thalassotalea castellviae]|uniref:Uncharacterized protein n=1 Tax=Thalassotalea castellviae TaxID=3075612 RepID=A0ABU2ZZY1_9GAMM|nr:hypothetical protein [Thalassotalea sp. W431]MDT0603487.1 hypothetical protein [Thalassotalea sp. W431]